jgi:hypothetical protein
MYLSVTTKQIQFEIDNSGDSYPVLLPKSLKMFLYHYKYSRFIECNRTIAGSNIGLNVSVYGKIHKYKQDPKRNDEIIKGLSYVSKVFEKLDKPYWISSGTLLGDLNDPY